MKLEGFKVAEGFQVVTVHVIDAGMLPMSLQSFAGDCLIKKAIEIAPLVDSVADAAKGRTASLLASFRGSTLKGSLGGSGNTGRETYGRCGTRPIPRGEAATTDLVRNVPTRLFSSLRRVQKSGLLSILCEIRETGGTGVTSETRGFEVRSSMGSKLRT